MNEDEKQPPQEAHQGDASGNATALEGDESGNTLIFSGDEKDPANGQ
jgi:hypothetical protein